MTSMNTSIIQNISPQPGRRSDAVSNAWKAVFLAELEKTGVIGAACSAAGVSPQAVHYAKNHDKRFLESYLLATEWANEALEDEALKRAKEGVLKPVYYRGTQIGEIRQYNDNLLMFLL